MEPKVAQSARHAGGVARLAAALLGIVVMVACQAREGPSAVDLMASLERGVFVDYEASIALGSPPRRGEFPESAAWVPLPITAGRGWLRPSRGGWHPIGRRASLDYRAWSDRDIERPTLRLDLRRTDESGGVQRLEVIVDDTSVGVIDIAPGLETYLFPLELRPRHATIELEFEPPLVRERSKRPPITLVGFGLADQASVRGKLELDASPTVDPAQGILRFSRPGELIAPLSPAPLSSALSLEWRCPTGLATLEVRILDGEGGERAAMSSPGCRQSWQALSIRLDGGSLGLDTLSLGVRIQSRPATIEVRRVALIGARGRRAPVDAETAGARPPAAPPLDRRPDILLIVLDAARVDNFGFAGYERDTSPHIDRLAAEALVFERAYSECPNTSCSIPNLITGVPFMNLGTVFKGRKIPDEVTTLAEYLKPLGYRTVGFSANPNNSPARNSHQGFDHFERLWGAHNQAERARQVILEQSLDEPLYLQLHFLPPHQPYMPLAGFDLFTDPSYEGPVHPKVGLRRYTAGYSTFSPADLEQLIALYDGNLRMVDDAVGAVFAAMQAAGRWEQALVLLTADHGEAFGEHDDFQHNSTLFDEMLHVPFVLRLPGGEVPVDVDTGRTVALADAVPTLLGRLGLTPRPEVWGIDLLSGVAASTSRLLFHRTAHNQRPLLGIRSDRWKAVTGKSLRWPILLDLESDPLESSNLAAERPALFSGLVLRLRDFIDAADLRVPRSTEDVELSPEETKLLRSLGYVQ